MQKPVGNPLIDPLERPHGLPAFDLIAPEHFLPALRYAIFAAEEEVEAIKNNRAAPTFANTVAALEASGKLLSRVSGVFSQIAQANTNDAIKAMEEEMKDLQTRHGTKIALDQPLFERIRAVYDSPAETARLDEVQARLLEDTYQGFARNGATLPMGSRARERIAEIDVLLSAATTKFNQNELNAVNAYKKVIDDEADLRGIPQRNKDAWRAAAREAGMDGKWLIGLSPWPTAVMQYAESRALREELWRAMTGLCNGGDFDNRGVVLDIVSLRHERARLLGFDNHAAFVLKERMAKTPETVMEFLDKNEAVYKPAAARELEELRVFAGVDELKPWDYAFYARRHKEKTFDLDLEEVRAYFSIENVREGVRRHVERLFGLSMEDKTGAPGYAAYHPDVRVYEFRDKASGRVVAAFFEDYYARDEKQSGAWMNAYRDRHADGGKDMIPLGGNTGSFDKPQPGVPTLLSLDEVRTFFHEIGHFLHCALGEGTYESMNGINVRWDFIELPSQLQENWALQKEVLDTFAVHYKTGEKMPAELVDKIAAVEQYGAGYAGQRQTFLGFLDMAWHTADPKTIASVEDFERKAIDAHGTMPYAGGLMTPLFSHLFGGGYAAGYYGYKWAEGLDADVFSAFREKGLYDETLSRRLRETIYSKGNTRAPEKLFADMMGRAPDWSAMFRREGLLPSAAPAPSPACGRGLG